MTGLGMQRTNEDSRTGVGFRPVPFHGQARRSKVARPVRHGLHGCRIPIKLWKRFTEVCQRAAKRMPVFITLTGVPSNKQEGGGKGKEKVAKVVFNKVSYVPIKSQVAVLKPIIDKISITYIGNPGLTDVLVQNLMHETEAGGHW